MQKWSLVRVIPKGPVVSQGIRELCHRNKVIQKMVTCLSYKNSCFACQTKKHFCVSYQKVISLVIQNGSLACHTKGVSHLPYKKGCLLVIPKKSLDCHTKMFWLDTKMSLVYHTNMVSLTCCTKQVYYWCYLPPQNGLSFPLYQTNKVLVCHTVSASAGLNLFTLIFVRNGQQVSDIHPHILTQYKTEPVLGMTCSIRDSVDS